jgi:predicted glycosyltransferase
MKRLLFYCQYTFGIGNFVRSLEIVRGLIPEFYICFVNGGSIISGVDIPNEIELVNLPAVRLNPEFQELQVVDSAYTLEELQDLRQAELLRVFDQFQPDAVMIDFFPCGEQQFPYELLPLLEYAKIQGAKVICSLQDVVATQRDRIKYEEKVCAQMNRYFDLLLVHSDPQFQHLTETFSKVDDLNCEVRFTGYVVQPQPERIVELPDLIPHRPLILVSVGGGDFGHELLDCVVESLPILSLFIPHQILMFVGPLMPEWKLLELQTIVATVSNIHIDRYTPHFLNYMEQAALSISLAGYNTTMNILTTGVRSLLCPSMGNDAQEQSMRAQKLVHSGIADLLQPEDLVPSRFVPKVITCLKKQPHRQPLNCAGVERTATELKQLLNPTQNKSHLCIKG